MKLLNYIKGDTRGQSSREIEKRSLTDPFLSEAIDGYECRAGMGAEHIKRIGELERDILNKTILPKNNWLLWVWISLALVVVCLALIWYLTKLQA